MTDRVTIINIGVAKGNSQALASSCERFYYCNPKVKTDQILYRISENKVNLLKLYGFYKNFSKGKSNFK